MNFPLRVNLAEEARGERKGDLSYNVGFSVLIGVGTLAIAAALYEAVVAPSHLTAGRGALIGAGGVFLGTGLVLFRLRYGRYLSSLEVSEQAVTLTRSNGQTKTLRWTDPEFRFFLLDLSRGEGRRNIEGPRMHPYRLGGWNRWAVTSDVPQSVFDTLMALAKANRLPVLTLSKADGPLAGMVMYTFV